MTREVDNGKKPGRIEAVAIVTTGWRKSIGKILHGGGEQQIDVDSGTTAVLGVNKERGTRGWFSVEEVDLSGANPPRVTKVQAEQEYEDLNLEGDTRRRAVYGTSNVRHNVDAATRKKGGDPNAKIPKVIRDGDRNSPVPKEGGFQSDAERKTISRMRRIRLFGRQRSNE